MRRIVIVGGGATGTAAALSLRRFSDRIDVVDPNPPGRGNAFNTSLLCNTSVGVMSLHADRPSDFLHYLHGRGFTAGLSDFVPRALVSQYCMDSLTGVRHVPLRAVSVHVGGSGYRVSLENGSTLPADDVIVCTGTGPPLVPRPLRRHVGRPNLFTSVYPTDPLLASLRPGSRVLILGTRLSAIDAALLLTSHGHQVVLSSRSGILPAVRTRVHHTGVTLDRAAFARLDLLDPALPRHVLSLVRRATGPFPLGLPTDPLDRLHHETALASSGHIPWQDAIADLIDLINTRLSNVDRHIRDKALSSCHTLVTRYISAFPVANARRLLAALEAGTATLAPTLLRIEPLATMWQATWPNRTAHFDAILCATGYHPPPLSAAPGLLRLDIPGTLPKVDPSLRAHLPGSPSPERIWLLGTTSHPRTPITNYLHTAVTQAAALPHSLLTHPHPTPRAA